MKLIRLIALLTLVFASGSSWGASLQQVVDSGEVRLESVRGNGSSTGNALTGTLVNTTGKAVEIDISVSPPLYFKNSGKGQNMLATQVLGRDGTFWESGGRQFIRLPAGGRTPVSLVAFCADFERPNPSSADSFSLTSVPGHLKPVARMLVSRPVTEGDMVALQVAVWLKQGKTPAEISETFTFTPSDLARARQIIGK